MARAFLAGPMVAVSPYVERILRLEQMLAMLSKASPTFHDALMFHVGSHLALLALPSRFEPSYRPVRLSIYMPFQEYPAVAKKAAKRS